ncbi:MAG TPA: site-2 protease family protein [Clostridiaceae bacterium]|jgi:Zn-dependent protease|nr:site-2 protease family protein [Clostridiaceae bacterium]
MMLVTKMCAVTLALPLLNFGDIDIVEILILIFVLALSLSLHEFAHAYAALKMGDDTAAMAGRLTLNPLKHLDPIGSLVFLIARIGWAKPVPINPSRFTKAKSIKSGIFWVSLAGPLSNLLLGTLSWFLFCVLFTIMMALMTSGPILEVIMRLFLTLFQANMLLAVFNLLPVPPLDGFKVFGVVLPDRWYGKLLQYERYIGLAFLFIVFFFRGALSTVLGWVLVPFKYAIQYPITWLFQQLQAALGLPVMPMFL